MKIRTLGVFDSGIGGLSILQNLISLPIEKFIYFADTANLPYGEKTPEVIRDLTENAINFLIQQNVDGIVIACHTASVYTLDLFNNYPVPVWNVVNPIINQALQESLSQRIGIIGTPATIATSVHRNLIYKHNPNAHVASVSCPKLVPIIESQQLNKKLLHDTIQEYLSPLQSKNLDTLILGCTHYELIKQDIQAIAGRHIRMISVPSLLTLKTNSITQRENHSPSIEYHVTGNHDTFLQTSKLFIHHPIITSQLHKSVLLL